MTETIPTPRWPYPAIVLQPMSLSILRFLNDQASSTPEIIAETLQLQPRQVNAAITRSLVRNGLVKREYQISQTKQRKKAIITVTPTGQKYVELYESDNRNSPTAIQDIIEG